MKLPQFRIRTLMFAVWLSALVIAGAIDVLNDLRDRSRVVVIDRHIGADGSSVMINLDFGRTRSYFIGPIPLGPWPVALFSGLAFVASVLVWIVRRKGVKRNG